jgi:Transglycosylase SLT domain
MADRFVRLNLITCGTDEAKKSFLELNREASKYDGKTVTAKAAVDDAQAQVTLKDLNLKLSILGKKVVAAEADVKDSAARAKLVDLNLHLDRIARYVAKPTITVGGVDRALVRIFAVDSALDKLSGKAARISLSDVGGSRGLFSRVGGMFSRAGNVGRGFISPKGWNPSALLSGAAGAGAGAPTVAGVGLSPGGVVGGLTAATALASLIPATLGGLLTFGVGGIAAAGAASAHPAYWAKLTSGISASFKSAFNGIGRDFAPLADTIGKFAKSIAPLLRTMFAASIPGISAFIKALLPAVRQIIPQLTLLLKAMTPEMGLLGQAFGILLKGAVSAMLGMRGAFHTSAVTIKGVAIVIAAILGGLGRLIGWLATNWGNATHMINDLVHGRWSATWKDAQKLVRDAVGGIMSLWHALTHDIDAAAAALRHYLTQSWGATWRDIINAAAGGVRAVVNSFRAMASGIWDALRHLPGILWNLAKSMVENLWRGAQSVAGKVTGFFSGLGRGILHALGSVFHFGSPSRTMNQLGVWIMEGLHRGIQSRLGSVTGSLRGIGRGVAQWAGTVRQALMMEGLPLSLTGRVLYQMQTESAGNPRAINLTDSNAAAGDPSRGLMQTIMGTFQAYHWPGTSWDIYNPLANIAAALNYARIRYGPSLMSGGMGIGSGHGYARGGWITEPIVGAGLRSGHAYSFGEGGIPEYVSPRPMMDAGRNYNINVNVTPLSHPRDVGREIVSAIKLFERGSGASWRHGTA